MKNKIHKYDFLIVGAGLIGTLTALALQKKNFKVLVIENKNKIPIDKRTLAVNANSKDFLKQLGIWEILKSKPQPINKIIIKDYINAEPLIFTNSKEAMGNVIFNSDLLKITLAKLESLKLLKKNINLNIDQILPSKTILIDKEKYQFQKIILGVGKNIISNPLFKSMTFDKGHYSYVGFFKHNKNHRSTAYEIFNQDGPLAVLPTPYIDNKKSTFIFSTRKKLSFNYLQSLIRKNFANSHGQIKMDKSIYKFPIRPHLQRNNKNFIFIGDSLKSIHPVAGQGWNLGVKDIQTLCNLTDQYPLDFQGFNSIYYSKRIVESTLYLSFTSILNSLYENKKMINQGIIKFGYESLRLLKPLRELFIKNAMGR